MQVGNPKEMLEADHLGTGAVEDPSSGPEMPTPVDLDIPHPGGT
jgi:hypothetical protein